MNPAFLKASAMPDVQSTLDERALPIEQVGIRGVRHPLTIRSKTGNFPSVGTFEMDVALPAHVKGTHMSRFMALLQKQEAAVDSSTVVAISSRNATFARCQRRSCAIYLHPLC